MNEYKKAMRIMMAGVFLVIVGSVLASCTQNSMDILSGATHARGHVHVEGYFTDTEAEADLCKVPAEYTPEQAIQFCSATP